MSDKEPWDQWNEMLDAARMLDWFNLRSRLAAAEEKIAANGRHAMRVTIAQLEARLAATDALLREARGYMTGSEARDLIGRVDAHLAGDVSPAAHPPIICKHGNMVGGCVACALEPAAREG